MARRCCTACFLAVFQPVSRSTCWPPRPVFKRPFLNLGDRPCWHFHPLSHLPRAEGLIILAVLWTWCVYAAYQTLNHDRRGHDINSPLSCEVTQPHLGTMYKFILVTALFQRTALIALGTRWSCRAPGVTPPGQPWVGMSPRCGVSTPSFLASC